MINRIVLILLSTAILSQTMNSVIIFAGYALNKDYITKTYCINKDKPKLHCNGKCHLAKELKSQEEKESIPVNPIKEKIETVVYLSVSNPFQLYNNSTIEHFLTPYTEKTLSEHSDQPFQPPRA